MNNTDYCKYCSKPRDRKPISRGLISDGKVLDYKLEIQNTLLKLSVLGYDSNSHYRAFINKGVHINYCPFCGRSLTINFKK